MTWYPGKFLKTEEPPDSSETILEDPNARMYAFDRAIIIAALEDLIRKQEQSIDLADEAPDHPLSGDLRRAAKIIMRNATVVKERVERTPVCD